MFPGSYINWDWYSSFDGKQFLVAFRKRSFYKRTFGSLEQLPPTASLTAISKFKIFVCGRGNVGKTSTICKLAGTPIPSQHYETPGLQITTVYWPCYVLEGKKVVLFHLEFWDAGESCLRKFDHILPSCKENVDAIMFLFSFVDKSSFDDLPQNMSRLLEPDSDVCSLVVGTKFDLYSRSEIPQESILSFQRRHNLPVLKINNNPLTNISDPFEEVDSVAPMLNAICEHLWHREIGRRGRSLGPISGPLTSGTSVPATTQQASGVQEAEPTAGVSGLAQGEKGTKGMTDTFGRGDAGLLV